MGWDTLRIISVTTVTFGGTPILWASWLGGLIGLEGGGFWRLDVAEAIGPERLPHIWPEERNHMR